MKCEYCDNEVPNGSTRCPSCGAAVRFAETVAVSQPTIVQQTPAVVAKTSLQAEVPRQGAGAKSRVAYILLGIFLGALGIHNFYAGRINRALGQLLTTVLAGWLFLPLIGVWIWCLVDVCAITTDGDGVKFN